MDKSFDAVFSPERFEPFSDVPDASEFDRRWETKRPVVLSNMAHAAYFDEADIKSLMRRLGAGVTSFHNERGAQAYLAVWPDKSILAFRGSEPREEKPTGMVASLLERINDALGIDIDSSLVNVLSNDVLADLRFRKVPFDRSRDVEVHEGFLGEIDKLWKRIETELKEKANNLPAWGTGHSLGAAMATLAGMRYPFEEVVTFGEPRVGRNIASAFKAKRHLRIVNGADPVSGLPPESFGYRHHGELLRVSNPDGSTDFRFDHSIVYYSENLVK